MGRIDTTTPPTGRGRQPALDGLRAVAALGVFAYHFDHERPVPGVLGELASHGNAGVPLFFAISGYLMYRPFLVRALGGPAVDLRVYAWRRVLRIVPAYWTALTLLALWKPLPRYDDRWWVLYLFGQGLNPWTFKGGIGAAWSLCIEVMFYAVLPLFALLVLRTRRAASLPAQVLVISALALASLVVHQAAAGLGLWATVVGYSLPGTFYLFAVGMLAAVLDVHLDLTRFARGLALLPVLGLAVFLGLALGVDPAALGSVHPAYGVLAVLLVLPAIAGTGLNRVWAHPALVWFGGISYAFYLWHHDVIQEVASWSLPDSATLAVALALTGSLATSSWYLVERPALRLARRVTSGQSPSSARPRTGASVRAKVADRWVSSR